MGIDELLSWKERGLTLREISERNGINYFTLKSRYNAAGIGFNRSIRHSWKFDRLYDQMDQEGQYVIGFLAADGYIAKGRSLTIYIQESDVEILYRVREILGNPTANITRRTNTNGSRQCGMCIGSVELVKFLTEEYGFLPNKSRTLPFPRQLGNPLPYLRGFFDGDGYIGQACTFTVSSRDFAEGLLDWVYSEYGYEPNVQMVGLNKDIYNIHFRKKHARFIEDLFSYPGLTRKTAAFSRYLPK